MDAEQIRIQSDLRGLLSGDVHCDALHCQMYASDASIYEIQPLGVARPRSAKDISELLAYCREHSISIFPRGGGSGLAGQSLGRGIVVDLSRYMRRIDKPVDGLVRVQSGVVQADLNRAIGQNDYLFGPDPATRSVSSIGSMLSVDAAGSHFPRYGSSGDCVESVELVLASGQIVELARHDWTRDDAARSSVGLLAQQVGLLLQQRSDLLLRPPWQQVARGCGYRFEKVLDGEIVDLARLVCGSEGTLGIITAATLRVEPIPAVRGLLLVFFSRLDAAAKAAVDLQEMDDIAACDLMDRRLLEIARETEDVYESIIPRGAEAMLLVEIQGEDIESTRRRLNKTLYRIEERSGSVVSYRLTTDNVQRNLLWRLARRFIPRLYRLKGNQRPLPFVEDISVPPEKLPEFLRVVQDLLKQHRVTATLFAHALHGQIDVRPFFDLASPKDQVRLAQLGEDIYAKVIEFGGCVSGEQAFGLSRAAWAERQLGQRLELSRKIKRLFDPTGIMNPGKFLSPSPPRPNENLRPVPFFQQHTPSATTGYRIDDSPPRQVPSSHLAQSIDRGTSATSGLPGESTERDNSESVTTDGSPQTELPVLLDWNEDALGFTARSCNGCGRCRTSASAERMCPVFRVHKGEESSPRAKANLLRGVLTGSLDATEAESRELKEISDLCFNCHQCRIDCPASVDIPKLVLESKGQHVAAHGLPLKTRLLNRLDLLANWGSRFPRFSNWAIASPTMRWCLEKAFGIAAGRKLPRVARFSFLWWAGRNKLTSRPKSISTKSDESSAGELNSGASGPPKVCYFVDQYVNLHNPMLGRAVVHVLKHQGIEVFVPPNQTPSWMAMIAAGDIARARKRIQTNVKILADAVRQGYTIVTSEPSAALCLTREYPALMDNDDTRLIAENTVEVNSFLWDLHTKRELKKDFSPVQFSVVYHQPCHARALDSRNPALQLLKLIPGLEIDTASNGCSGMAGTFGLERKNFITSVRIGIKLINKMKYTRSTMGSTECTACKLQMEQGTTKATIHPVAIMAYAYGNMPQIEKWFHRESADYIAS